jgi:cell wall-associated NlpC family hydrolase
VLVVVVVATASGCAWGPRHPPDASPAPAPASPAATQAVHLATGLIGTPYRWGGATPDGFDCSGLVYYTFGKAGLAVPRTSQAQYHAARPVPIAEAEPGDLVFFGRRGRISHVGIYLGDERFVHAPESGRTVTIAHLSDGYYRTRFAGAGRID